MSGGGAKGGPQAVGQQPMGGGKGGPQGAPGPGQQVRPGNGGPMGGMDGPQANYGMGVKPNMGQFANIGQQFNGLGSAGLDQVSQMPAQQGPGGAPGANLQSMMQAYPGYGSGGPSWLSMLKQHGFPGGNFGGGLNVSGPQQMPAPSMPTADPRPMDWKPNPQPYQPSTGWTGNQPSQWAAQAEAIKPPSHNAAGLPTNGILAKLFGG